MIEPLRILLADGDDDDARIVESYLAEGFPPGGLAVERVATGLEALETIGSGPPDVLIVVPELADGSGLTFLSELRRAGIDLPVLFLAGADRPELVSEAIRAGATEAVAKPSLGPALLAAAIRHGVALSRAERGRLDAERVRRRSEGLMTMLAEAVVDILGILGDDGTIRLASPSTLEALGFPPSELEGRPFLERVHPDDRPRTVAALRALATGESVRRIETRLLRSDGTDRTFEVVGRHLLEGRFAPGIVISCRDVTERRMAAERLGESERRFRELFARSLDGIALHEIVCDAAGTPVDYRFLEVNPAFTELTGLAAEAVVGRLVTEVLPGLEPEWIDRYGRVALGGEPIAFEATAGPLARRYRVRAYRTEPRRFAVVFDLAPPGGDARGKEEARTPTSGS